MRIFCMMEALHYGRVCACILRGDISSSTNAGVSSWPSRLHAAPSHRALPNASHRLPCSARWLSRTTEPTAPFLIIPIDTSSTWVCPWCCDVSEPGAARPQPARSCAPLRGLLSSALFHVKHLYDHLMMRQGSPVKQAGATARTPTESERGRGSPHETIGNYQ